MIPKIIWQTHEKPFEDLEPFQKNIIGTWKNLNPGWEHMYVDSNQRKEHVKQYSSTLYKIYKISNGSSQSDIWRTLVTYNNGGVYADMDSVCTMPLDDMIEKHYNGEDIICSPEGFQTNPNTINSSNFAATKNSKTLKMAIDNATSECKEFLKNKDTLSIRGFGAPLWKCFSDSAIKNKDVVCFNSNYFSHSEEFKNSFELNTTVLYNCKTLTYFDVCNIKNFYIY
jgi:hypothetical protein